MVSLKTLLAGCRFIPRCFDWKVQRCCSLVDLMPLSLGPETLSLSLNGHYDSSTHEYTHTLTVVGRTEGLYTCTVANDRSSSDSAVQGNA